ncbi:MAG: hypothetical protein M1326_04710 [Cyanobacteria bacterium]|nr:hypothetical protein [Cyanobacteriota bacterium]
MLDAASRKLEYDIYFNSRKRNKIKKTILRLQRGLLQSVDTTIKPVLKQEYEDRESQVSWLNVCIKFLKLIKAAEEFKYETTLKNCRFKIYKARRGNKVIIEDKFFKPSENKNKITFAVFNTGFPTGSRKKCVLYRNGYEFDQSKFVLIDNGGFKQKAENFNSFSVCYKGKIFNKRILFVQIKSSTTLFWVKNI